MNSIISKSMIKMSRIDTRLLRLILILISLALLVIGAGAPEIGGGHT